MATISDSLANVGYVLDGIPMATEEEKAQARALLIRKGAFDIMEILGIYDQ